MTEADSGDVSFMIVSAALVLFMTPGLAFFYGGMVRQKNLLNTMMMSVVSMGLVSSIWLIVGFSLSFDMSLKYVGLQHLNDMLWPATKIPGTLFATYQMTFAIITAAIISGAVVERIRFAAYMVLICIWIFVVYVPLCYWVWGGGWIAQVGAKDFAGGTVVHISSGTAAYVTASLLGRRIPEKDGQDQHHGPHNVPFVVLGGALLWFGWTGFNGGSALASNWIAVLAITTSFLAASTGMVTWVALEALLGNGGASSVGAVTGAIAGLVGITPIAGFVSPVGSLATGVVTAVVCTLAIKVHQRFSFVDDTLDCFTVHGVGGYTGAILGGFLDTSAGICYGYDITLLKAQFIGATSGMAYSGFCTLVIFYCLSKIMRVRALEHEERAGMDQPSHAEVAYTLAGDDKSQEAVQAIQKDFVQFMDMRTKAREAEDKRQMMVCCTSPGESASAQVVQGSSNGFFATAWSTLLPAEEPGPRSTNVSLLV
eukprot:TRINITY_DN4093_c0_g1_i2.p1 TRINITY_DN4093_c0_g1~~TRINITY_DN4093_c0_g1_i2.p1  ORF type:complete len:483 (+),score=59.04 TRINITY_DN4093_c0_g1_i2:26-1474(+)